MLENVIFSVERLPNQEPQYESRIETSANVTAR